MIGFLSNIKSRFMEVICKRTNKSEDTVVSVGEASASSVGIWTRQSEKTGERRRESVMGFSLLYVKARNLKMRKYLYKESKNFACLLGRVHAWRERAECGAKVLKRPILGVKYKMNFYSLMLGLRFRLELGRLKELIAKDDYPKLKDMWWSILIGTYDPKY